MQQLNHDSSWGNVGYDENLVIEKLRHYLPAQAPLNDFIHHNTLHSFQEHSFERALHMAHTIFGYHVYSPLEEYRERYRQGQINANTLHHVIQRMHGSDALEHWLDACLHANFHKPDAPRIGQFRAHWKSHYALDIDARVHPLLFRLLSNYLDQGIAATMHPFSQLSFREALKHLNEQSFIGFFKSKRAAHLIKDDRIQIADLLKILVGNETYYERYLFDLCFAHAGWSGMVTTIETQPTCLIDRRKITLADAIFIELLMEIDALDTSFGEVWAPLSIHTQPNSLFDKISFGKEQQVLQIWQESLEWSFYNPLIQAIQHKSDQTIHSEPIAQAILCIDDRECSMRRYLEEGPHRFETFGTPGFFGAAFYFQTYKGQHKIKLCPAPITPSHLIVETHTPAVRQKEHHFSKSSFHPVIAWLMSPVLGLISGLQLLKQLIQPTLSASTTFAKNHHQPEATLHVDFDAKHPEKDGFQLGYKVDEMATIVYNVLKGIGLVKNFSPLVYVVGHGSSSTNNPHYAAYDCGACSGRAGSVNARVFAYMANKSEVRSLLFDRGIAIPNETYFVGCLHDTSRDEMVYYDANFEGVYARLHRQNVLRFTEALIKNSKERARRFERVDHHEVGAKVHLAMKRRTVALFEPRPEFNHATNAACIVGRRKLSQSVFLDRRSFLNSYDPTLDANGDLLYGILRAVAPVCGGINLEYYFSRLDNQKLGAGSKLPHNVVGLIGVSNGIEGDLRPGLPSQMIEIHDPLRLLVVVEQAPEIILSAISRDSQTFNWFQKNWVRLVSIDPNDRSAMLFDGAQFEPYQVIDTTKVPCETLIQELCMSRENLPIQILSAP
jgi:uncharacterized protein